MTLWQLYDKLERPLWPILARMERNGIGLDLGALAVASQQATKLEEESRATMARYGVSNPNSTQQLRKVLFDMFGLKAPILTESGDPSTSKDVVAILLAHDLPPLMRQFVQALDNYRAAAKLKNTYIDKLPTMLGDDGRLHGDFNQAIVETGRLSSSNPNLQNIPARTPLGKQVRRAFIPRQGNALIKADYSQLELRVMAALTRDPALLRAYKSDPPLDIHSLTCEQIFGTLDKDKRRIAKTANFGVGYGASGARLSLLFLREAGLLVPVSEANDIKGKWWDAYYGVREWREQEWERIKVRGYTQTYFGRRNYLLDYDPEDRAKEFALMREYLNLPIQGTGADLVKMWMIAAAPRLYRMGAEIDLQVHDELVVECPHSEVDEAVGILQETGNRFLKDVPIIVEVTVGPNWQDTKGD